MRATLLPAATALALVALAACSTPTSSIAPTSPVDSTRNASVSATFAPGQGAAITYKPDLVPAGATVKVTSASGAGKSTVTLELSGLLPDRRYGAHAHTKPCGAAGTDAGPHYQDKKDPVSPSVDPGFANPQNEIWLDVTTDAQGKASATSTVGWVFTDAAHPASVVVHANHTLTEPGKAGTAGDRLACVTVAF
jgi:Copper/zinc superoxide dismutase (SODC).